MRLFAIRNKDHKLVAGEDGEPLYFPSKDIARKYRESLTERHDEYFITYGIDHKLYKRTVKCEPRF